MTFVLVNLSNFSMVSVLCIICYTLIKKKIEISSYMRKFRRDRLPSHILTASSYMVIICAFPHILRSPSSYMTLPPPPSEFPYIRGKFHFLFYQWNSRGERGEVMSKNKDEGQVLLPVFGIERGKRQGKER
jgi:hypothetical protein